MSGLNGIRNILNSMAETDSLAFLACSSFRTDHNTTINLVFFLEFRIILRPSGRSKKSKKISNDQELIQSDSISCPQNQKGNN